MKLLILGGTRFLGRHLAEQALAAGHEPTLLHRGRSGPGLLPEARHLLADRDADLSVLDGPATWDAVIDTSAYRPRQVHAVADRLAGRVGVYQLVSSISAYASLQHPDLDETAPLAVLDDPTVETVTAATYGGLKASCEHAAVQRFGAAQTLCVRPGLLVGPHDPTGRFSWWVQRLLRGGDVLAPGPRQAPVQFIDARDAAAWMLRQAQDATAGAFNLSGPVQPQTMAGLLEAAVAELNPQARLCWADGDWLLGEGVTPWTGLPLWLPGAAGALHQVSLARARAHGLATRPLHQTLRDTATWLASAPPLPAEGVMARPAVGLAEAHEAALLARRVPAD